MMRAVIFVVAFLVAGLLSSAGMQLLAERAQLLNSVLMSLVVALGSGFLAWVAFRSWRRTLPLLCATAMGICSGTAGVGGVLLLSHFLGGLVHSGISSAPR